MADRSGSARLEARWELALQAYENKTGVALAQHPLAFSLQTSCPTDDIATLLQRRAQAFDDFRQRDRMMGTIKTTVSILTPLSHVASLVGLVRQKALIPCSTSLTFFSDIIPARKGYTSCSRYITGCTCRSPFICRNHSDTQVNQAANGVITSYDVLADLLELIERFVNRLRQYTQLPPTPAMDEVLIKLNVELISTLATVTGKLNSRRLGSRECSLSLTCFLAQRHAVKFVKNFLGVKDIKEARQRLDRLVQEEVAAAAAQILGGVDRLERKRVGGKRARLARTLPLNHTFLSRWRSINRRFAESPRCVSLATN